MSFLDGDGRQMLKPNEEFVLPGTRPLSIRRSIARSLFHDLLTTGRSMHSSAGGTLWLMLQICHEAKLGYELHVRPGEGYYIKVIK